MAKTITELLAPPRTRKALKRRDRAIRRFDRRFAQWHTKRYAAAVASSRPRPRGIKGIG